MNEMNRDETLRHAFEMNYSALIRTAFYYVKDYMLAEDMVQEGLMKSFERFDTFQQKYCFKAWLFRIVINQCKDYLRSYTKRHVTPWDDQWIVSAQVSQEEPLDFMIAEEDHAVIHKAVASLNPIYSEAVHLYYFDDLSIKQMSMMLYSNENTLKTRMKRARDQLKSDMEYGQLAIGSI